MLFEKQIEDFWRYSFLGKDLTTLNYLVENYFLLFFFYDLDKY